MDLDLTLSPETIQEYANASDRNLTCPASKEENPTVALSSKEAGLGTWTEKMRIRETDLAATKSDPTNPNKFNFVVQLEVLGNEAGGFKTNAGRVHYQYFFIDKTGLASADPKTAGMYKRRLAVVNSLLSACGVDLAAGIASYASWFTGEKPLVGQTVAAVIRKYRNNKTNETGIDVDGFSVAS